MRPTSLHATAGAVAFLLMTACGSVSSDPDAAAGDPADAAANPVDAPGQPELDAPVDAALSWSAFEPVTVDFGRPAYAATVTPDELTVYFNNTSESFSGFDIFYAQRTSLDGNFGAAGPLPIASADTQIQRYPEISHDGLELYFSNGDTGPIMVATRPDTNSTWGEPVAVGVSGNFASISGDKLALYYVEHVEGIEGQLRRITRAAVGQPWSSPTTVPVPGVVEIYSSFDISRDELSILRAPAFTNNAASDILVARRASRSDAFDSFEVLMTVESWGSAFRSARWNADETAIWISRDVDGVAVPHVSRLE